MSLSDPTTRTSARARAAARPDQALEKALSHPLRWQILALLGEGTRTPAAIARELGVRTENVSYHVRVLSDLELIELVGTTPVRGTLEHHYRARPGLAIAPAEQDGGPLHVRRDVNQGIVREVIGGLIRAFAGEAHARGDARLARVPVEVDEEGWRELDQRVEELLNRVREIQEESVARARRARHARMISGELVLLHYPRDQARA